MRAILLSVCLLAAVERPSGYRMAEPLGSWISASRPPATNVLMTCRVSGMMDLNAEFAISHTSDLQGVVLYPKDVVYAGRLGADELRSLRDALRDSGVLTRRTGAQSYLDGGNWECEVRLDGRTNHVFFNAIEAMTDPALDLLMERLDRMAHAFVDPSIRRRQEQQTPTEAKGDPMKAQPDGPASGSQPIRAETNSTASAAGSRR